MSTTRNTTTLPDLGHAEAKGEIQHQEEQMMEDGKEASQAFDQALKSEEDRLGIFQTCVRYRKAVLICTLLCVAAGCDGYQIALNGNIIANSGFIRQVGYATPAGTYLLRPNDTALWGALQSLGQLVANVGLTPISDKIGRKWTLYVLWVILACSLIIETLVQNAAQWAGAKFLAGMGIGAIQATLPVIIAEVCPTNIRGAMSTAYTFWNSLGFFLAPVILYALREQPLNFRLPIITQWAFQGAMLPILLWIPETPAFFATKGRDDQGLKMLRRINGGIPGYDVEAEYAILKATIEAGRRSQEEAGDVAHGWRGVLKSYKECFNRDNFRRTLGASLAPVFQQTTGLSFLNIYSSLFFREAGFSNAFQITSITSGIRLAAGLGCAVLNEFAGRRRLVIWSGALCTVTMLVIGSLGTVAVKTDPIRNTLIAMACVWSAGSTVLGSLSWAFIGEVPTQRLRARASGLAYGMSVVLGLTFNTSVPVMLQSNGANLGYSTAWLFFGAGSATFVLAWLFVPETTGRSTAELDELYRKSVPCWRMRKYETEVQKQVHVGVRA